MEQLVLGFKLKPNQCTNEYLNIFEHFPPNIDIRIWLVAIFKAEYYLNIWIFLYEYFRTLVFENRLKYWNWRSFIFIFNLKIYFWITNYLKIFEYSNIFKKFVMQKWKIFRNNIQSSALQRCPLFKVFTDQHKIIIGINNVVKIYLQVKNGK